MSEMECTAQAFEEVQEQNLRLLQQIKEKDDANFKVSGPEPYCGCGLCLLNAPGD